MLIGTIFAVGNRNIRILLSCNGVLVAIELRIGATRVQEQPGYRSNQGTGATRVQEQPGYRSNQGTGATRVQEQPGYRSNRIATRNHGRMVVSIQPYNSTIRGVRP